MPTDTPDLPTRLRTSADTLGRWSREERVARVAMFEAANEIERLQVGLDQALAAGLAQADEARLRAGLQVLVAQPWRAGHPAAGTVPVVAVADLQNLLARPTEESH